MKLIDTDYHEDCQVTFIYEDDNEEVHELDVDLTNKCTGHEWEYPPKGWDGNPTTVLSREPSPYEVWEEEKVEISKDYWEEIKETI